MHFLLDASTNLINIHLTGVGVDPISRMQPYTKVVAFFVATARDVYFTRTGQGVTQNL